MQPKNAFVLQLREIFSFSREAPSSPFAIKRPFEIHFSTVEGPLRAIPDQGRQPMSVTAQIVKRQLWKWCPSISSRMDFPCWLPIRFRIDQHEHFWRHRGGTFLRLQGPSEKAITRMGMEHCKNFYILLPRFDANGESAGERSFLCRL